jgi:16S rRNA (cytosine967-C5)-methyltransferase
VATTDRTTAGSGAVTPARASAFATVRRVFEQGAYADRALQAEAAGLDARARALATAISYGTVQRRATLDHVAARLTARSLDTLDPPVLAALRLGLFQLLYLDGVADHAAVNESVELVKATNRGGASLVNAVLRRAARDASSIVAELDDDAPASAAILHSVPLWLAERWWAELGADEARALLRQINEPAESALRVNELVASVEHVTERLPVPARGAPQLPEGLILGGAFDAHGSQLFADGAIMPQSRASMLVGRAVAPQPGDRVLDLCAAPGAKTTHLAALARDDCRLVAVERHAGRARALERTCRRMHASCVHVEVADATELRSGARYGRVLVDPPCSGLGTLQSRPDLRWRASLEAIAELATLQSRILERAAIATAPGGTLVYSVCTISRAEGSEVVDRFLRAHPEFAAPQQPALLLPHRDGTDGFFIATLRRRREGGSASSSRAGGAVFAGAG